ncbi:MAG TPA: hypothetical protein VGW75_05720 [Solirubrobacteraceae bacterium]|jgi:hypothetical protein|nr:hypothetical protein [Solirubrobacteraceae bacterium]
MLPPVHWMLDRLPLAVASAATVYALLEFEIADHPKLPVIDGWLSAQDARVVAKAVLLAGVFVAVYIVAAIAWRSLLHATPTRLKGPLGFELDWSPEDAKGLRDVDERQQDDLDKLATLVRDLAAKVKTLERRK